MSGRIVWIRPNNPRQPDTQGWHNWSLYRLGLTYEQYRALPWDPSLRTYPPNGRPPSYFRGPRADHWDWDVKHGHIVIQ